MEVSTAEKIKLITKRKGLTLLKIAEMTNQTNQNLANKLKRNDMRESELKTFANMLDCDLKITFIDRQTKEEF